MAPIISIIEDLAGGCVSPNGEVTINPVNIEGLSFTLLLPWRGDTIRVLSGTKKEK